MSNVTGAWEVGISKIFPERLTNAFSQLDALLGAEYDPLLYLGSQMVNGENHAILAKQTLTVGRDQTNIVLIIFHIGTDGNTCISNIERVLEGGALFGGIQINPQLPLPDDAEMAFEMAFSDVVGISLSPIMLLGSQAAKGTNYFAVCEATTIAPNAPKRVVLATANLVTQSGNIEVLLPPDTRAAQLGYAFNWLSKKS